MAGRSTGQAPRVLHVSQPVDAGVAAVVEMLALDQAARGWDVVVACPDGPLGDRLRDGGVRVERWAAGRSPSPRVPAEARALGAVIDRVRPGLVHLHSAKAGLAGRLVLRGALPTLFQPHGWSFDAVRGAVAAAATGWERLAVRWTDRLVCVSSDELDAGRRAGVGGPAVVVPNGVQVPDRVPWARAGARRALHVPSGPLVVCVGRVTEQKGQDTLLDAWSTVTRAVPGARLLLVGDGPSREAWQRRHPDGDSVRWIGAVDDPSPYYDAADVVAVPSRWEGMALVPLEAMAAARSVVAFGVAGIRESIGPDAGAVLAPGDGAGLAAALVMRLSGPELADAEGLAGRSRVLQRFDRRRTADGVAALVDELLDRESPRATPGVSAA